MTWTALFLPPLGAALWYKRGTLKPPDRYRIGFRREVLDLARWANPVSSRQYV